MTGIGASLADAIRDRYALSRALGRGGMATVYLADDLSGPARVLIPHAGHNMQVDNPRPATAPESPCSPVLARRAAAGTPLRVRASRPASR